MKVKAFVFKPKDFENDFEKVVGAFIAPREDITEIITRILACSAGGEMMCVMIYYRGEKDASD